MAASARGDGRTPAILAAGGEFDGADGASPARRDEELRRMAAFRIREAANRVATLANNAQSETLRRELMAICETLLEEERGLLDLPDPPAGA
jgi:hypothetical protein